MEPCAHPSWCFVFQQWETSSKQADGIQDSHEGRVGKWDRGGSLSLPGLRVSILFQVVLEGCADKKTFEQRPERAQLSGGRTFQMEGVASVKHWGRNSGKRKRQCGSEKKGRRKWWKMKSKGPNHASHTGQAKTSAVLNVDSWPLQMT